MSGAGAADVRELPVVPYQLLTGVRDVSAKGGEEIERGTGGRGRRIRAGAALMILGIIGDLMSLPVIVQAIQSNGGMDTISGQAFSRLMIVRRNAVALKYGKARMTPGKKDVNQPLADLFLCQQRLQELVAEQEHDLDRIGPGKREEGAVRQNQSISNQTVKMGVIPGWIIAIRLD
jgi:hypothetical protein